MNLTSPSTQTSCVDDSEIGSLRVDAALAAMLETVCPICGFEQIDIGDAVGRALHEAIVAPFDVPAHSNSAVDGYAVRAADLPDPGGIAELPVVGLTLAGRPYPAVLQGGQALRIMTGAALPEGADTVLMQEHVETLGSFIRISDRYQPGDNVRHAGEDIRRGETILRAGRYLTPADIGLIASLGRGEVRVKRRLRVALLSTGDEIRGIGQALDAGCVYDSNRYTLTAAFKRLGVRVSDLGICPDQPERLKTALIGAADQADVVITSGGVSVGEADYVKQILAEIGEVRFWKVAIKPGRPIAFGQIGESTVFGLPGNPVAVMVTFYHFVLPVLERRMGLSERPIVPTFKARTTARLRKKPGRTEFQRGIIEPGEAGEWCVRPAGKQGSGILRSMSLANAFIILPHESGPVEPGEEVTVLPFAALM
ncbi:MAG TPA: gephyrin-like molybdotransferase Glp [Methylococcaceae bacterium]|nr:gephyrin-like molybdotransferase Glp [Methylococcaceae bacterium]